MKRVLFYLSLIMVLFTSCQKNKETIEESRYYVKYTGTTSTLHIVETTYTITTDTGQDRSSSTGANSDYSVTIGPVTKGFQATIICSCPEEKVWIKNQRVTIEVSKNGDPFALKASGTNQASYTIDY